MNYMVHHTPGRMRIKIPELMGNPVEIRKVSVLLERLDGIEDISCKEMTGSIVVLYDESVPVPQKILAVLKENDYYDESRAVTHDEYVRGAVKASGKKISTTVAGWALGKAIEDTGFALLAALI